MAAKRSTRATRTKSQTADEFDDVRHAAAEDAGSPGEQAVRKAKEEELRAAVAKFSVESTVQSLTSTGLSIGKTIAGITEQLQQAAASVEELKQAKDLFEKDMEALHGKEVAASAIEDLVEDYEAKKRALQEELASLSRNIEAQRDDMVASWDREQQAHEQQVKDREAALLVARKRDDEQYNYNKGQERQRAEQAWQIQMADLKRANELKQADLTRSWAEREAALNAKEQEFNALKARVEAIQNEIDSAVKKEVAIATNALTRDHKHAVEIMSKDFQSKEVVLNSKVQGLEVQLASAVSTIAKLQEQLTQAQNKVAEIANSALTAASDRQALAAVQSFATQTGSNAQKKA